METNGRFDGITRPYTEDDVARLRGTVHVEHTLARLGAERLWQLLARERLRPPRSARSPAARPCRWSRPGSRRSTCPAGRSPRTRTSPGRRTRTRASTRRTRRRRVVRRINNALLRADQIARARKATRATYWLAPIVADAEAGFGGPLNAFELMKAMIEAGAAGVHFEDQLASEKKCGHLGGKVLVPTSQFVRTLVAARLAADVLGVPTLVVARTDALSATLITSDVDERDRPFITGERTAEGFFRIRGGIESAIARGARVRAVRGRALVRDVDARPRRGARVRRGDPRAVPRQAAGLQLLAVLQLAPAPGRRRHRAVPARARRRWATGSSSSRSPASTR